MPDATPLDLANLDNWHGFRLGMTREQVIERLHQLEVVAKPYGDDQLAATLDDQSLSFWFETPGSDRLRQISIDGDICWNGKPVIDLPLDGALRAFEPLGRPPMWENNDATDEPFPEPGVLPAGPVTDEELIQNATVWLPDKGLGLVIWEGGVMDIAWRDTKDLPAQFAGPVTDAQRQLSLRPDLEEYLTSKQSSLRHTAAAAAPTPKDPLAPWYSLLVWVCLGLLVFIGRKGFVEMRLWAEAPTITGKFVAKETVPRKKYLDLGPEVLRKHMPDDPTITRDLYLIEYLDPERHLKSVKLEGAEFYVPPEEIGTPVDIVYLAGDPPQVKGPSRARDVAFIKYLPWAMVVGVFYIIGQFVIRFIPGLLRGALKMAVPKGGGVDPDRPELR